MLILNNVTTMMHSYFLFFRIETNEEKYRDLVEKFLPALKKRVQLRVMEKYLDLKKSAEEIKYNVLEYVRQREYEKLQ